MSFDPSVPVVKANIAALRANISPYQNISTQGFTTASDGGGGLYYYNSADTTSADNGGTIIVDAAGHRYYRVTTPALPPRRITSNTNLTTAYLNQFIDAHATCTIRLPSAASSPLGTTINFTNTGGVTTITCFGSDAILVNSGQVTSETLNGGDTLIVASALNGSTPCWLALGGSAQFPSSAVGASYAPLASPAFTGTPTAPTPTVGDSSTKIATTAFVEGTVVGTAASVTVTIVTASGTVNPSAASQELLIDKGTPATTSVVLPAASNWPDCPADALSCPVYTVKDIEYNSTTYPITVTTADALNIDGSSSYVINSNGAAVQFVLAGGYWYVK